MLKNVTKNQLLQLNLKAIALALDEQREIYIDDDLSFEEQLSLFLDLEINERKSKRIERLLKSAKLRYPNAAIENISFSAKRNLKRSEIAHLYDCQWIARHQNIHITGATGCGKTWLACAFAQNACRLGFNALYIHWSQLLEQLSQSMIDGSLPKLRQKLIKMQILVIDDIGLSKVEANLGPTLLEIIDRQSVNGALILTSQYSIENWHSFFKDATVADAILDRIVHHSHFIELKGESMRKKPLKT